MMNAPLPQFHQLIPERPDEGGTYICRQIKHPSSGGNPQFTWADPQDAIRREKRRIIQLMRHILGRLRQPTTFTLSLKVKCSRRSASGRYNTHCILVECPEALYLDPASMSSNTLKYFIRRASRHIEQNTFNYLTDHPNMQLIHVKSMEVMGCTCVECHRIAQPLHQPSNFEMVRGE